MSRYGWEAGSLKIPSKDFIPLKKKVREAYNGYMDYLYKWTLMTYEKMIEHKKTKTGGWNHYMRDFWSVSSYSQDIPESIKWNVIDALSSKDHKTASGKPQKPKRSWFPHIKNAKSLFISGEDFSISLSDNKLIWKVEENNKAIDYARRHTVVKTLWSAVNSISWTRGSGGEVVGNNEYNVDYETDMPNDNLVVAVYSAKKDGYHRKYPL